MKYLLIIAALIIYPIIVLFSFITGRISEWKEFINQDGFEDKMGFLNYIMDDLLFRLGFENITRFTLILLNFVGLFYLLLLFLLWK